MSCYTINTMTSPASSEGRRQEIQESFRGTNEQIVNHVEHLSYENKIDFYEKSILQVMQRTEVTLPSSDKVQANWRTVEQAGRVQLNEELPESEDTETPDIFVTSLRAKGKGSPQMRVLRIQLLLLLWTGMMKESLILVRRLMY